MLVNKSDLCSSSICTTPLGIKNVPNKYVSSEVQEFKSTSEGLWQFHWDQISKWTQAVWRGKSQMKSNLEWWHGCSAKTQVYLERTPRFWQDLLTVETTQSKFCWQIVRRHGRVNFPKGSITTLSLKRELQDRKAGSLSLALAKSGHMQSVSPAALTHPERRHLPCKLNIDLQRMLMSLHLIPHEPLA